VKTSIHEGHRKVTVGHFDYGEFSFYQKMDFEGEEIRRPSTYKGREIPSSRA